MSRGLHSIIRCLLYNFWYLLSAPTTPPVHFCVWKGCTNGCKTLFWLFSNTKKVGMCHELILTASLVHSIEALCQCLQDPGARTSAYRRYWEWVSIKQQLSTHSLFASSHLQDRTPWRWQTFKNLFSLSTNSFFKFNWKQHSQTMFWVECGLREHHAYTSCIYIHRCGDGQPHTYLRVSTLSYLRLSILLSLGVWECLYYY